MEIIDEDKCPEESQFFHDLVMLYFYIKLPKEWALFDDTDVHMLNVVAQRKHRKAFHDKLD